MQEITPITVQGIVHSDPKCFRMLYDAYYAYLCGLAVSYIPDAVPYDENEVEDIVHSQGPAQNRP